MKTTCCDFKPKAAAVALGRWGLGVMVFFIGLGKFLGPKFPDITWFAYDYIVPRFEKTWLPNWLLVPYAFCLPFAEVMLGALLILGIGRNRVLFLTGLMFVTLSFGQVLLKEWVVVSENMIYLFVTGALLFLGEHDRWVFPIGRKSTGSPNQT